MLCNYCNSNHIIKLKEYTKKNYEDFSARNGYKQRVQASAYTLGDYFDKKLSNKVRNIIETNEYIDYKEYIYKHNLISFKFLNIIPVNYLREVMNKHNLLRIDIDRWDNLIELTFNNDNFKWDIERLLWISRIKDSGLFANIPDVIILEIITIVNTKELPASTINYYYHNFIYEIQKSMINYEAKHIKIFHDKITPTISDTYHAKQCYDCTPCYTKYCSFMEEYRTYKWCDNCKQHNINELDEVCRWLWKPLPISGVTVNKHNIYSSGKEYISDYVLSKEIKYGIYSHIPDNHIVCYAKFKLYFEDDEDDRHGYYNTLSGKFFKMEETYMNINPNQSKKLLDISVNYVDENKECVLCNGKCNNTHYDQKEIIKNYLLTKFPEINNGIGICWSLFAEDCDCIGETHSIEPELPYTNEHVYMRIEGYFEINKTAARKFIPYSDLPYGSSKIKIDCSFKFYLVNNIGIVHFVRAKLLFKKMGGLDSIIIREWKKIKTNKFLSL